MRMLSKPCVPLSVGSSQQHPPQETTYPYSEPMMTYSAQRGKKK